MGSGRLCRRCRSDSVWCPRRLLRVHAIEAKTNMPFQARWTGDDKDRTSRAWLAQPQVPAGGGEDGPVASGFAWRRSCAAAMNPRKSG